MNFLEALRGAEAQGMAIRHASWSPGVLVRWSSLGWQWSSPRVRDWTPLPAAAFFGPGLLGAPVLLAAGWEVA